MDNTVDYKKYRQFNIKALLTYYNSTGMNYIPCFQHLNLKVELERQIYLEVEWPSLST